MSAVIACLVLLAPPMPPAEPELPPGGLPLVLARFPSRETCEANCAFALEYRRHIDGLLEVEYLPGRRELLLTIKDEAYRLWDVWDDLRIAHCYQSAAALERVVRVIGPRAFNQGWMPPHVPVWRFRRID
jgi:hypothetical protein